MFLKVEKIGVVGDVTKWHVGDITCLDRKSVGDVTMQSTGRDEGHDAVLGLVRGPGKALRQPDRGETRPRSG